MPPSAAEAPIGSGITATEGTVEEGGRYRRDLTVVAARWPRPILVLARSALLTPGRPILGLALPALLALVLALPALLTPGRPILGSALLQLLWPLSTSSAARCLVAAPFARPVATPAALGLPLLPIAAAWCSMDTLAVPVAVRPATAQGG